MRNKALDLSKGIAITLVVIGHTIQNLDENFDQNLWFRIIYSFHMPFFIMLSGVSAFYWFHDFNRISSTSSKFKSAIKRIRKSVLTLLVPFYSWGVVDFLYNRRDGSLINYLSEISFRTDLALWFLPSLFCCISYLIIILIFLNLILKAFPTETKIVEMCNKPNMQILLVFLIWLIFREKIPNILGTGMANNFHGGLFLYFLAGIWIQLNMKLIEGKLIGYLSAVSFLLLTPFWSRIEEFNLITAAPEFLKNYYIGAGFSIYVGLTGSFSIFIFVNMNWRKIPKNLIPTLTALGTYTLGIYAIHGYFIASRFYVITPILASLCITMLIDRLPIVRTILLGRFDYKMNYLRDSAKDALS